jgi:hypothetical protein
MTSAFDGLGGCDVAKKLLELAGQGARLVHHIVPDMRHTRDTVIPPSEDRRFFGPRGRFVPVQDLGYGFFLTEWGLGFRPAGIMKNVQIITGHTQLDMMAPTATLKLVGLKIEQGLGLVRPSTV